MFWLNIDRLTGVWKLHREDCIFSKPQASSIKGLNEIKENGGWIQVESMKSAHDLFEKDHAPKEYWQPCKACKPEKTVA